MHNEETGDVSRVTEHEQGSGKRRRQAFPGNKTDRRGWWTPGARPLEGHASRISLNKIALKKGGYY